MFRHFALPVALTVAVPLAPAPAVAQRAGDSPAAPAGWSVSHAAGGVTLYTPPDLQAGEMFAVAVYPAGATGGTALDDWAAAFAARDPLRHGDAKPVLARQNAVAAVLTRIVTLPGGKLGTDLYSAVRLGNATARMVRVTFALQNSIYPRYQAQVGQILQAVRSGRAAPGMPTPPPAPAPAGGMPAGPIGHVSWGGPIQPGLYVGVQTYGKQVRSHWRLYLYADGEYRMCDQNDKELSSFGTGRYAYKPRSGEIDIAHNLDLINFADAGDNPDRSLYGRDGQGRPVVFGDNNHGFAHVYTLLRYAGPATRPAPDAEAAAKARAQAEARRYKWVTAPGRGVPDSQIAAVVHFYHVQTYFGGSGLGTNTTDQSWLLLKNGAAHQGLSVPPDQLDVARSRSREPQSWGRWRRAGGRYEVAWAADPAHFAPLPGAAVLPARPGTRLAGHWGTGSSTSSLAGGSYRLWGVTFTPGGRFIKDDRGGAGNSQFMQQGGQAAVNTTYDDAGSYTSVAGGTFTIGTGRPGPPASHRSGTYSLSVYTLTLRYDDGRVERCPFFFVDPAHEQLSFEGNQMARDKER